MFSIEPLDFSGKEWGEPRARNCRGQSEPLEGAEYPGPANSGEEIVKIVLGSIQDKAYLLDVTLLTQLRKDGHPSTYAGPGSRYVDCSHWCLPGVPDTWNEILYAVLLKSWDHFYFILFSDWWYWPFGFKYHTETRKKRKKKWIQWTCNIVGYLELQTYNISSWYLQNKVSCPNEVDNKTSTKRGLKQQNYGLRDDELVGVKLISESVFFCPWWEGQWASGPRAGDPGPCKP